MRYIHEFASFEQKTSSDVITIVSAGWLATMEYDGVGPSPQDLIEKASIAFQNNRILHVGTTEEVMKQYSGLQRCEHIKLSDSHIIIPGLINCHTHLAMSFLRGIADDMSLQKWLTEHIWPTEKAIMCDDYVYHGTRIALVEAIRSGTTMLNDSYFLPKASMQAVVESGLRCVHACPLLDFGNDVLPSQWEDAKKLIVDIREDALAHYSKTDHLLRPSFNPHAAYTVPQEWIKKGCDFINELNQATPHVPVIYHTHLHESTVERDAYEKQHGKTALQAMDEAGAVNQHMVAAHCVEMTTEEIELMIKRKANVCHCPKSNAKLASGQAPIQKMLSSGLNVCLGTDGGCSNNSVDMLSEMAFTALHNKIEAKDPIALDAYTILRMATRNGSKALGRLADLGSLEPGKLADIVAVDLSGKDEVGLPIFNPISHLIYTTHPEVTHMWVNGKCIMENSNLRTIKLTTAKYKDLLQKIPNITKKTESTVSA